jgi:hypothetical protein
VWDMAVMALSYNRSAECDCSILARAYAPPIFGGC